LRDRWVVPTGRNGAAFDEAATVNASAQVAMVRMVKPLSRAKNNDTLSRRQSAARACRQRC
jgi:hypothetical protein